MTGRTLFAAVIAAAALATQQVADAAVDYRFLATICTGNTGVAGTGVCVGCNTWTAPELAPSASTFPGDLLAGADLTGATNPVMNMPRLWGPIVDARDCDLNPTTCNAATVNINTSMEKSKNPTYGQGKFHMFYKLQDYGTALVSGPAGHPNTKPNIQHVVYQFCPVSSSCPQFSVGTTTIPVCPQYSLSTPVVRGQFGPNTPTTGNQVKVGTMGSQAGGLAADLTFMDTTDGTSYGTPLQCRLFVNGQTILNGGTTSGVANVYNINYNELVWHWGSSLLFNEQNVDPTYTTPSSPYFQFQIVNGANVPAGTMFSVLYNQQTGVAGDPVISGFQGQNFYFHGTPNDIYSMIESPTTQMHANFTWISEFSEHRHIKNLMAPELNKQIKEGKLDAEVAWPGVQDKAPGLKLRRAFPETDSGIHPGTYLGETVIRVKRGELTITAEQQPLIVPTPASLEREEDVLTVLPGVYETGFESVKLNGEELYNVNNTATAIGGSAVRGMTSEGLVKVENIPSTWYAGNKLDAVSFVWRMDTHRVMVHTDTFHFVLVNADGFMNVENVQANPEAALALEKAELLDGVLGHTALTKTKGLKGDQLPLDTKYDYLVQRHDIISAIDLLPVNKF